MNKYYISIILITVGIAFCFGWILKNNNDKNSENQEKLKMKTTTKITTQKNGDYSHSTADAILTTEKTTTNSLTTITTKTFTSNKVQENNHITNFKIKIVDKSKNPVSDLKVSILNVTGDKYNYTPDLSLTNNEGVVTGTGEYKKYQAIIEDVSNEIIYNKIILDFELKKDNQTYTFVWPYETPDQRKEKCNDCIYFEFKNDNKVLSNLHIELYVGHYETNERWNISYPEKIDLGHTDKDGKITWDSPKPGKYTIFSYIQKGDDSKKVSKKITVSDIPYTYSVNFS